MKRIFLIFFSFCFSSLFSQTLNPQSQGSATCKRLVLQEDYSSDANWYHHGDGSVHINNGVCLLDQVANGSYNRVYKDLQVELSDTYWKAEFRYSILSPNPSSRGAGAVVLALTADTLPFIAHESSQGFIETNQDGIGIVLFSNSHTDHNINNWLFLIEDKKGSNRNFDLSKGIYLDALITDYYLRLERISKNKTQMSVFSDSSFSSHLPGSPVIYPIDSSITDLTMIQHGISTPGSPQRLAHATIDDSFICDNGQQNATFLDWKAENHPQLLVYPNPAKDRVVIRNEHYNWHFQKTRYSIYTINGAKVLSNQLDENGQIDVSDLVTGMYLIQVLGKERTYRARFQIEE